MSAMSQVQPLMQPLPPRVKYEPADMNNNTNNPPGTNQQVAASTTTYQQPNPQQQPHQTGPKPRGRRKKIRTEPERPTCPQCEKRFSNQSALTKHKLTHSDERKFACQQCSKAFKRHDHLTGHMQTHSNRKPFNCTIQGCDKTYCDARSLRRHKENIHHIVTPKESSNNSNSSNNTSNNHNNNSSNMNNNIARATSDINSVGFSDQQDIQNHSTNGYHHHHHHNGHHAMQPLEQRQINGANISHEYYTDHHGSHTNLSEQPVVQNNNNQIVSTTNCAGENVANSSAIVYTNLVTSTTEPQTPSLICNGQDNMVTTNNNHNRWTTTANQSLPHSADVSTSYQHHHQQQPQHHQIHHYHNTSNNNSHHHQAPYSADYVTTHQHQRFSFDFTQVHELDQTTNGNTTATLHSSGSINSLVHHTEQLDHHHHQQQQVHHQQQQVNNGYLTPTTLHPLTPNPMSATPQNQNTSAIIYETSGANGNSSQQVVSPTTPTIVSPTQSVPNTATYRQQTPAPTPLVPPPSSFTNFVSASQQPSHLYRRRILRLHSDRVNGYTTDEQPRLDALMTRPLEQHQANQHTQHGYTNNNNQHHHSHLPASFSADYASTQHFTFNFNHPMGENHMSANNQQPISNMTAPHSADSITDSGLGLNSQYEQQLTPLPNNQHQQLQPPAATNYYHY